MNFSNYSIKVVSSWSLSFSLDCSEEAVFLNLVYLHIASTSGSTDPLLSNADDHKNYRIYTCKWLESLSLSELQLQKFKWSLLFSSRVLEPALLCFNTSFCVSSSLFICRFNIKWRECLDLVKCVVFFLAENLEFGILSEKALTVAPTYHHGIRAHPGFRRIRFLLLLRSPEDCSQWEDRYKFGPLEQGGQQRNSLDCCFFESK